MGTTSPVRRKIHIPVEEPVKPIEIPQEEPVKEPVKVMK